MSNGTTAITIHRVADLTDERVEQAVSVFVEAFSVDRVARYIVGGQEDLRVMIHRACVRATVVGGELHVAVDRTGQVVGTACWFPPGCDMLSDEEQYNEGFVEFFSVLQKNHPSLHEWWFSMMLPRFGEISSKLLECPDDPEGINVKKSNWELFSFCVLPSWQDQGIGRMLLKIGEDQAAAAKLMVCLEAVSDEHVEMFVRLGYTELGSGYLDGLDGEPGFRRHTLVKYAPP